MAITLKLVEGNKYQILDKLAKNWVIFARLNLDSSYPTNGYTSALGFSPSIFGLKEIRGVSVVGINGAASGQVIPRYDYAAKKLLMLRAADALANIIVEETVTVASNAGRLANVPAYILSCQISAGGTTGAAKIVPVGSTVGSLQVAVNFLSGAITTFSTDAATAVKITYIPLGVGPFVEANRIVDEAVVLGNAAAVNLANRAALIQYVYNTSGATAALKSMDFVGVTNLPASGQIYVDLNSSSNTALLDNAANNAGAAKVTYWKYTPFIQLGATKQASNNATSSIIKYTSVNTVPGILIPAFGTQHAAYATNTDVPSNAMGPSATVAANSPLYDPVLNRITFVSSDSITRDEYGFVVLTGEVLGGVSPGTAQAEVPAGTNLSGVTIDVMITGRPR